MKRGTELYRFGVEPVILGRKTLTDAIRDGSVKIVGDTQHQREFWAQLVDFKSGVPLTLPR